MKIEDLISKLEEEFDELSVKLEPNTDFKQLDEWSSMHALIIIALVDTEYDIILNGKDLRGLVTVQNLYDLILDRNNFGKN